MPTTVILGSGIIGLSTAYYLSLHDADATVHLVDSSPELFACASGRAAGFLARDWHGPAVAPLGALSFDLHKKLAEEFNGKERWGYGPTTSYSLDLGNKSSTGGSGEDWLFSGTSRATAASGEGETKSSGPAWLTIQGKMRKISETTSTAQVNPLRLCQFLLSESLNRGVKLHQPAKATRIVLSSDDGRTLSGINIHYPTSGTTQELPCDNLIFACGVWTPSAYRTLFPDAKRSPDIISLSGHHVVFRSPRWPLPSTPTEEECHAVFTTDPSGFSPEIFSRVGGEIWLGGFNHSDILVPELATDVEVQAQSVKSLIEVGKQLCGDDVEIIREGFCHRPVKKDGVPFVGRVNEEDVGVKGRVFVASGHGPWGISHSLGTGWVVSEMVRGMETSVNIDALRSL